MPGKMAKNVTAPRKWKSSPDSPPTQLAYVTQPEIDLLVDADIHGSLKRGPNRGPQGIMSLDGGGGSYWGGSSGSGSSGSGSSGGGGGGQGPHWNPPPNIPPPNTPPPGWTPDPVIAPVITGTPNFGGPGDITSDLDDLLAATTDGTVDNTSEIISDAGWNALTNAGNIDNNIGITTLADGTISVPELTTSSTKPVEPFINVYGEEVNLTNISDDIWDLAVQASTKPGYELSYEGQGLMNEGIMPGSTEWVAHFGLPQIVGTSTSGIPLTSGGYTDEYGQEIPIDIVMTGLGQTLLDQYDDPTGSYQEMSDDYWEMREAEQAQQGEGPGWEGYDDYDDYYGDRRQSKLDLLNALAAGAPSKGLEQSGFFDTSVDPYAEDQRLALEKGIFSGMAPGYTGEGMKRLLRSYGSGLQSPRYENVARGGIMGPWNNMRR